MKYYLDNLLKARYLERPIGFNKRDSNEYYLKAAPLDFQEIENKITEEGKNYLKFLLEIIEENS